MYSAQVQQFLNEHYDELCAMAKKRSMGRVHVEELLIDEAIDRVPRAIELYDTTYGTTLKQYVFDSIRRYMIKKLMTLKHVHCDEEELAEELSYTVHDNLEDKEEVHSLLKGIHPYYAWLLITYHQGYNFTQIAEATGLSKGTVRNYYHDALEAVREICHGVEKVALKGIGEDKHLMVTQEDVKQS